MRQAIPFFFLSLSLLFANCWILGEQRILTGSKPANLPARWKLVRANKGERSALEVTHLRAFVMPESRERKLQRRSAKV